MPSGHGKGTHVCSGPSIQEPESPCASPDIYPSRKNDPSWTAGHTDNNHSTDENCSVRADYPQGTMLCQDQCRTGGCLPLGRSSRISCVSSCRKLLIKRAQTRNRYHTGEMTLRTFVYTPILSGLRHRFARICPLYLLGWILKNDPMVGVISPHFNSSK